jgi:hypothetical protein
MLDRYDFEKNVTPVRTYRKPETLVRYNGNLTEAYLTKFFCMHVVYFVLGNIIIVMRPGFSGRATVIDSPKDLQVYMLRLLSKREDDHLFDLMVKTDERKMRTVYRRLVGNPEAIDRGWTFLESCLRRADNLPRTIVN